LREDAASQMPLGRLVSWLSSSRLNDHQLIFERPYRVCRAVREEKAPAGRDCNLLLVRVLSVRAQRWRTDSTRRAESGRRSGTVMFASDSDAMFLRVSAGGPEQS
jgi:hypothetical protein